MHPADAPFQTKPSSSRTIASKRTQSSGRYHAVPQTGLEEELDSLPSTNPPSPALSDMADDPETSSKRVHDALETRDDSSPSSTPNQHDPHDYVGGSPYDRKCLIVNKAIDEMGMGRYQWCIWGLCGFGYFIDLLWAQAFGLVLSPLQQEFGFDSGASGNISSSFNAGLTAGAAFWGILVDIIGRQWAFNLTVLFSSVFGLALAGANDYNTFLILTAFVGFGVGGNIPIDTTITLENIPQRQRRLLPFLSVFQPMGVVVTTAITYGFIPNYSCKPDFTRSNALPSCNSPSVQPGQSCCSKDQNWGWRYTLLTVGSITSAVFLLRFFVFKFQESPKYLLYRGRDDKAADVLQNIAKFNRQTCDVTADTFQSVGLGEGASENSGAPMLGGGAKQLKATYSQKLMLEFERYKILFAGVAMTRLTILIWLTYICDYWGFTVAGYYLPTILAAKNSSVSEDLTLRYTYRSYIYIYLPGIVGVLLGVLGYDLPRVGRKYTMILSSALMGISLFLFATVNSQASNIGLNLMEYFFQSMFNAVLYGWTPEAYPAPIRGTACGVASFFGRLFGIVSPLIAASLAPGEGEPASAWNPVLYLAGGVTLGCVLWVSLLPSKMIGRESL